MSSCGSASAFLMSSGGGVVRRTRFGIRISESTHKNKLVFYTKLVNLGTWWWCKRWVEVVGCIVLVGQFLSDCLAAPRAGATSNS